MVCLNKGLFSQGVKLLIWVLRVELAGINSSEVVDPVGGLNCWMKFIENGVEAVS